MDDQKYCYENDEFIFNFKSNEVIKKKKKKIKIKKRKETSKKTETEGKIKEKDNSNIFSNKKCNTKIMHKYDKYQFVKNRNIIDILSSKQNKSNLGLTGEQITKNSILIESETVENNNNEDNTIRNIYDIFNSVQTFSLSNEKSFDNTSSCNIINNNKNSKINLKIKNNHLINEYNNNSEEKKQKLQKKWKTNILNLTTELNENNISSEHKENNSSSKSKFFFDDEVFYKNIKCNYLLKDKKNKNFFIENYFQKDSNTKSYKNLLSKPSSIKLNSSELLLNNIKRKNCVLSQNFKNCITPINLNQNKSKSSLNKTEHNCSENFNSGNISKRKFNSCEKRKKCMESSNLNDISFKTNKSKKKHLSQKKVKFKNIKLKYYFGPIDIGLVSLKNIEESIDDIINKMNKKGFECKKMKDTLIRCIKKKKVIDIEITKIKGDIIYFLAKKLH